MVDYASRLNEAMTAAGITHTQLAVKMGISYQAVRKVLHGTSKSFSTDNNATASRILRVRSDWLAKGTGPMRAPPVLMPANTNIVSFDDDSGDPLPDDFVYIKEYAVKFSGGSGYQPTYDEIVESQPAPYPLKMLAALQIPPAKAKRFRVGGDSMKDTLHDGDTILVNTADTAIVDGKVYAIRYGDDLRVKRLFKRLDGGLILHSDNPDHMPRDEELTADQANEHISIIGRVRDKSGPGGL